LFITLKIFNSRTSKNFLELLKQLYYIHDKKRAAPTLKSSQKNGEATGASNLVAHKATQKNLYNLLLCKRYTNKHFGESPFLCVGLIFKSDNDWNQSGFGICHPNPILFWHFHFRKIELSSWQLEIILF